MSAQKKHNPYFDTLLESRLNPAGHSQVIWNADIQAGVPLEKVLTPGFFKQVATRLRVFDKIIVKADDCSFYAELIVLQAEPGVGAKVDVMYEQHFGDKVLPRAKPLTLNKPSAVTKEDRLPSKAEDYDVYFGGADKWKIVRKGDNAIIGKGYQTPEEANKALEEHLQSGLA